MHWIYKRIYDTVFTGGILLYSPLLMYLKNRSIDYIHKRFVPCRDISGLSEKTVWVHSVSLGESNAALPIIKGLKEKNMDILATASTPTGYQNLRKKLKENVCLAPWDTFFSVESLINKTKPKALVIMETELWPALIISAQDMGTKVIIANGRISDSAFKSYKKIKPIIEKILDNVNLVLVQNESYMQRFMDLGMPQHRIKITGNIKYDVEIENQPVFHNLPKEKKIVLLASTHPTEEEQILKEIANSPIKDKIFPIVAPRHIERAKEITGLLTEYGYRPAIYSKTKGMLPSNHSAVVIDTIGVLARAYQHADIAFIGGSLVDHGGQNPIEAAYWSTPMCFGPHMQNFKDIAGQLISANAAIQANSAKDIIGIINQPPASLQEIGENAKSVIEKNKGAGNKTVNEILSLLG